MKKSPRCHATEVVCASLAVLLLLAASAVNAAVAPQGDPVAAREMGVPGLFVKGLHQPLADLPEDLARTLRADLGALGLASDLGFYDVRAGRWGSLIAKVPLVPGPGVGNTLTWAALGIAAPTSDSTYKDAVWQAFRAYLQAQQALLGVDTSELAAPSIGTYENNRLVHVYASRVYGGVPVRDSFVKATLNSGNLVLYGTRNWGTINISTTPNVSVNAARGKVASHLSGFNVTSWGKPQLVILPVANGGDDHQVAVGDGYRYELAWALGAKVAGSSGSWEALVDAHSGELLQFADTNLHLQHKKVVGGIFPISNDGLSPGGIPDGLEQPGYPMGNAFIFRPDGTQLQTNSEGLVQVDGEYRTRLTGPFVRIQDNCGLANESTTCSALDLGTSAGTDCAVPAGHSVGDTHSGRTGFWELNRIIDQAKSWLGPTATANTPAGWLNRQMPANMNINNACNAFFSPADTSAPTTGSINFYRRTVGNPAPPANTCRNTGEIPAVFDHEWGHGLDTFDNSPGVSLPGEFYADGASVHRLNDSCVARGFFINNATGGFFHGNGDVCLECTGVREVDWMKRQSRMPHDLAWVLDQNPTVPGFCPVTPPPATPFNSGPCQRSTHCEGSIIGEAVWDLLKRDLRCHGKGWEAPFPGSNGPVAGGRCKTVVSANPTIDENSALVLGTRLFYLAAGGVVLGYQCDQAPNTGAPRNGGCNADSWYMGYLAADDDDGNIANGTPHMSAIEAAFRRHGIACRVPVVPPVNTSCAATPAPTAAPTVNATAGTQSATITWTDVTNAAEYWILRTDGVHGCDFGKTRVARISDTAPKTFTQTDLLDGFTYYYSVVPVGGIVAAGVPVDSCAGPMSACAAVTPLAPVVFTAASAAVQDVPGGLSVSGGDGDEFADNCENATLVFQVNNTGGVSLTNVQVTAISPSNPLTTITTSLPISVAPLLAAGCGAANASAQSSFAFKVGGQTPQSVLTFDVTITADQIPGGVTGTLRVEETETDLVPGSQTFNFETDTQGWTVPQGTFNRTNLPPPGANGTAFYMKSSVATSFACDRARSPEIRLGPSSSFTLFTQFTTEPDVFDRGNVQIINAQGQEFPIAPTAGRPYSITAPYDGCNNSNGWGTTTGSPVNLFAQSTFGSSSLASFANQKVRLQVTYGTDVNTEGDGFQFDEVVFSNVLLTANDGQSDVCINVLGNGRRP